MKLYNILFKKADTDKIRKKHQEKIKK